MERAQIAVLAVISTEWSTACLRWLLPLHPVGMGQRPAEAPAPYRGLSSSRGNDAGCCGDILLNPLSIPMADNCAQQSLPAGAARSARRHHSRPHSRSEEHTSELQS